MAEGTFTPEIFEQSKKVEEDCQKLQALLDDNIQNSTFMLVTEDDELILFKNEKRKREKNCHP
jgi:hypothetical protein